MARGGGQLQLLWYPPHSPPMSLPCAVDTVHSKGGLMKATRFVLLVAMVGAVVLAKRRL